MDVQEAIRTRRSIRKFKPDLVPEEDIRAIVDLATQAPSASNQQMWKFLAITNKRLLEEIRYTIIQKLDTMLEWPEADQYIDRLEAAKRYSSFFVDAPVTMVIFGEPYRSPIDEILQKHDLNKATIDMLRQRPDIQSVSAAIENLCLAAHSMGYGTCWMSAPCVAGPELKALLDIEDPWQVMAFVPIGIPDEKPLSRPRKPLEEVLEFIS